jgi:hypothetical protein
MKALKFFLGSSNVNEFGAINGYFYNARVYSTAGSFKADGKSVSEFFSLINKPPSMLPG